MLYYPRMYPLLYFQPSTKTSAPEKLAGVRDIMARRGHAVQVIEERPTARLVRELWEFWHPIGAIVDCGGEYNDIDAQLFAERTVVFLGHNPDTLPPNCLLVSNDQAKTAQTAARELLSTGYGNFAFVHPPERKNWSLLRERGFVDALALNGKSCAVFAPCAARAHAVRWMSGLRRFLASLPRPCAVFAANDKTAESVLAAAALEGMSAPGDIAVMGVDNFAPICEHTSPPLSSIEPDFRRGGNLAAMMLIGAALSKGKWEGSRTQTFGPLRVVRRGSTRMLVQPDHHVSAALDLIRQESCAGLTAARVAALFPCSRRMADMRFRRSTGHTILDEIHAVQLERAKQLLSNGNLPLKVLSDFCGFGHPNSLRKFFLKATGMTMSAWRNHGAQPTKRRHDD